MKRILSLFFVLFIIISLFSCRNKSEYDKIVSQLKDGGYDITSFYDEDMIASVVENASATGLIFEGKITNIAHFAKSAYVTEWVYVYEFEKEDDAKLFYEDYAKNWDYARRSGTAVVYGASRFINNLDI